MAANFDLRATEAGQVDGRDIFEVIRENFRLKQSEGNPQQMLAELRKWCQLPEAKGLSVRVLSESVMPDFRTQQIAIETEAGLELAATLYLPNTRGRKPAPCHEQIAIDLLEWIEGLERILEDRLHLVHEGHAIRCASYLCKIDPVED
jgi:hypothetical protein